MKTKQRKKQEQDTSRKDKTRRQDRKTKQRQEQKPTLDRNKTPKKQSKLQIIIITKAKLQTIG